MCGHHICPFVCHLTPEYIFKQQQTLQDHRYVCDVFCLFTYFTLTTERREREREKNTRISCLFEKSTSFIGSYECRILSLSFYISFDNFHCLIHVDVDDNDDDQPKSKGSTKKKISQHEMKRVPYRIETLKTFCLDENQTTTATPKQI